MEIVGAMGIDAVLEKKIKQLVDESSSRYLGVSIDRLSDDLTAKITKAGLVDIEIDGNKSYREAKREFRRALITRMLLLRLGNISEVAKDLDVDRRTIHRLISELGIDVAKIKKELARPYDIRLDDMNTRIEDVLDRYKEIIHPTKLETMYRNVSELSDSILRELPVVAESLKKSEDDFERAYLKRLLDDNRGKSSSTARRIGIRHETLIRKAKELGLR
jgi:DNA-binding NtrC family response regulator